MSTITPKQSKANRAAEAKAISTACRKLKTPALTDSRYYPNYPGRPHPTPTYSCDRTVEQVLRCGDA